MRAATLEIVTGWWSERLASAPEALWQPGRTVVQGDGPELVVARRGDAVHVVLSPEGPQREDLADDIQAALGSSQLQRIRSFHAARERLADRYDRLLAGLPLRLPARLPGQGASDHIGGEQGL